MKGSENDILEFVVKLQVKKRIRTVSSELAPMCSLGMIVKDCRNRRIARDWASYRCQSERMHQCQESTIKSQVQSQIGRPRQ